MDINKIRPRGAIKPLCFAILLLTPLLSLAPLNAQDSYSDFERGLQLSNEQRSRILEIRRIYMDEFRTIKRQLIQNRLALKKAYERKPVEREYIERLEQKIEEMEYSRENLYNQYISDVSRILNEEQREQYKNFCNSESRKNMRRFRMRDYGR